MLHGETTTRSTLAPAAVIARLPARAVAPVGDEPVIGGLRAGAHRRQPHARAMPPLQRVTRRGGAGPVPGYRTLNARGGGRPQRGRLYHRLFSRTAPGCTREPAAPQRALASLGAALTPLGAAVPEVLAAGGDDLAVAGARGPPGHHAGGRVQPSARLGRPAWDQPAGHLAAMAAPWRPLAPVVTELGGQRSGPPRPKRHRITAHIASVSRVGDGQADGRTRPAGTTQEQAGGLVEVRRAAVAQAPWWLLTDRPVATAAQAAAIFTMYRPRWAVEDAYKVGKPCRGWDEGQGLVYDAVRRLVALGWVGAGCLYERGVTLEGAEVRLRRRWGGGADRPTRPGGQRGLRRGLRRLLAPWCRRRSWPMRSASRGRYRRASRP